MNYLRPASIGLLGLLAVMAVWLLSGPAGFGPGGQSAEAALLSEVKKLTASDAEAGDQFGVSVAVSGDTAVVGALLEDAGGSQVGAAYVFQRDQGGVGNWGQVKKLTASDAQSGDSFGQSVAVSGDTAVVGAHFEASGGSEAGAAYVFGRDQGGVGNWGEVKKLTASDAQVGDQFGLSVAISGDTVVVATPFENAGGFHAGAGYVFQRDQGGTGNWGEVTKLTASDAQVGDFFGISVAVSGNTAVVGTSLEDAGGDDAGAAYVFEPTDSDGDGWSDGAEAIIGTDPLDDCADDTTDDANPADLNNDTLFTSADLSLIAGVIGQAVPPAPARRDIAPATPDGFITSADLSQGAARIGQSCAP